MNRYRPDSRSAASARRLYRSRNGLLLGVCRGIAEWRDIPVIWVRLAVLILVVLSGFWLGLAAYVVAGLLIKPEPVLTPDSDDEFEFYDAVARSRRQALQRLQRTFDRLDRRTQRLEHAVTSTDYRWSRRLAGEE